MLLFNTVSCGAISGLQSTYLTASGARRWFPVGNQRPCPFPVNQAWIKALRLSSRETRGRNRREAYLLEQPHRHCLLVPNRRNRCASAAHLPRRFRQDLPRSHPAGVLGRHPL